MPRFAALIFARLSGECFRPRCPALMFARLSGDRFCFAALSFARCSRDSFLPRFAALIFARVSGESFLPRCAPLLLARVSGELLGRCFLPRWAVLIFARVSDESLIPRRVGATRPQAAAASFARFSGEQLRAALLIFERVSTETVLPRCTAPIFARVSFVRARPLTPSPPSVRLTSGPRFARPIAAISARSYSNAAVSVSPS